MTSYRMRYLREVNGRRVECVVEMRGSSSCGIKGEFVHLLEMGGIFDGERAEMSAEDFEKYWKPVQLTLGF